MAVTVDFEPLGRRVQASNGETILEICRRAGILINSACGGMGHCLQCRARVMAGRVSPANSIEHEALGMQRIEEGWHLACQARIEGDAKVYLPPESLATVQRIQTEGLALKVDLDPTIHPLTVKLPPASTQDLRADDTRLGEAINCPKLKFPLPVLQTLPDYLRKHDGGCTVFLRDGDVVGIASPGASPLGFAVDLGTTKVAAYLVDLSSGMLLTKAGVMNPQIPFGEDVISRINHAMTHLEGGDQLRSAIVNVLNELAERLCKSLGRPPTDIAEAVVVGNTAMHHLFLGLPVGQLGQAPYVPVATKPLDISAQESGLNFAPGANIHLLPNIAGYVGADHVAMLLGAEIPDRTGIILGLDIGTNTEISLMVNKRHYACSTASGPAFEGAHIRHGMRAAPGAIEKVILEGDQTFLQTIDNQPPIGLCGSGILDLVAQLVRQGIIDHRGVFTHTGAHRRVRQGASGGEYVLVPATTGHQEVTFSRRDINEIQLAKAAIQAGIKILLQKAGIESNAIDRVILAGAFGTYLDIRSGIEIGMFPDLPVARYEQVGNAAGVGACLALLSRQKRLQAVEIARRVQYVELTTEPDFFDIFSRSMYFERSE